MASPAVPTLVDSEQTKWVKGSLGAEWAMVIQWGSGGRCSHYVILLHYHILTAPALGLGLCGQHPTLYPEEPSLHSHAGRLCTGVLCRLSRRARSCCPCDPAARQAGAASSWVPSVCKLCNWRHRNLPVTCAATLLSSQPLSDHAQAQVF